MNTTPIEVRLLALEKEVDKLKRMVKYHITESDKITHESNIY